MLLYFEMSINPLAICTHLEPGHQNIPNCRYYENRIHLTSVIQINICVIIKCVSIISNALFDYIWKNFENVIFIQLRPGFDIK